MKEQTIAQFLNIKSFPFGVKDGNGNVIYLERADRSWRKWEYDSNGNQTYHEDSGGYWYKQEYDSHGRRIYHKDSTGYWCKWEYDSNGKEIYCEDSNGRIRDNRPKIVELTLAEIAAKFDCPVNLLRIKE